MSVTLLEQKAPVKTVDAAPFRALCTDCGISRTAKPERCGTACQFIKPDYPGAERAAHGRERVRDEDSDERFFGPFRKIWQASLKEKRQGAQWTGLTTELAGQLLTDGKVDAVLTMRPDKEDRWKPVPTLVTDPEELAQCRGMRMGYAPLLSLIEPAIENGLKRLAVIAIPCQVYALRALEKELGLDALYIIGTPCSDNTTTENFHQFLNLLSDQPQSINYLEFRADYRVELRFENGKKREIPFLKLPISKLPSDFFPLTCQTCVDYTNSLADITVGYMGGRGEQWLIVRNEKGEEMLSAIAPRTQLSEPSSRGNRTSHVAAFKKNVERSATGLPLRAMPDFLRPIVGWLMPKIGPAGQEFARTRVEMKAVEAILHLRSKAPARIKNMIPDHVWALAAPYDLTPSEDEKRR